MSGFSREIIGWSRDGSKDVRLWNCDVLCSKMVKQNQATPNNLNSISQAYSTDIVFFQKQEKVSVRVPNDLKCYENRDLTCTHRGRSPLQNLNLAGIWGNITLFNHYLSRANHQQTQKIIYFNMSFCIKKSMHLQNFIIFSILLDVSARADFS